ncbi:response regulator transcription factor [Candidatus Nitrospira neomarina]|uniref:Response regulator transcription factor n=1 Tax=Candidatus Nitrospira neomarina TaxID=3020899 RepID=A0AA96GL37_9BACT|nr:response regulator transcription factor [Candidatus Nitrospira neomarina]WNM62255.1 response regulator transcription factor [Candidatus Nitrospira neomarina]
MNTRILLADDHQIIREGLASLLERQSDMEVIQQVSDGLQAVNLSRDLRPDVVVMDVTMPGLNGIEATRLITNGVPAVKVLCLTVHEDTRFISAVLDAGASGYVHKDCAFEELVTAIHTVIGHQIYLCPRIAGTVVDDYKARRPESVASVFSQLTEREREIVQLLAEGQSTKAIADRLCLSVKTVGTHREHCMAKLQLQNLAQLTKYAIREGLTSVDS